MISLFIFIIVFILVVGLIIISTVLGFIRSIFGLGRNRNASRENNTTQNFNQQKQKAKIFEKKDGEYVDYEEIKD